MPDPKPLCPTALLSDEPTQTDAFGHTSVASAIGQLVATERGSKCIGLTGPWGSGKSSVVELLRKDLAQRTAEISIFVFDAWAHQGDPLRRTFLEQLINHLLEVGWLNRGTWEKRKEKLAKRLQETVTTNTPVLRPLGIALALSFLVVPFSYELLLKGFLGEGASKTTNAPPGPNYVGIAGMVLTLLPVLIALIGWVLWRPNLRFWTSAFWMKHKAPHQDESILSLFLNKSVERIQSSTLQTPDPTSVEFQETFASAVKECLDKQSRKLLIVADNLDRVEEVDARAIWATLRTFFDFDGRKLGTHLERLWLLVPFDSSGISRLWDRLGGDVTFQDMPDSEQGSLTDSFLAKTFQITFRVAPPVLSDWQAFLKSQLRKAFPRHSGDDFHRVYRIYDLRVVRGTAPPTPRDLKLFVNRIGAIHRQWQDDISLPVQALYVVLSSQNEGGLGRNLALKTGEEILSSVPVDMVGADWRESIAAIHFNVPKARALQVLIGNQLTTALLSGDEDNKLEQMAAVPGFYGVLEKQLEESQANWVKGETNNLAYSAAALAKLKDVDDASWKRSWEIMGGSAARVEQWASFGPQTAAGITELLRRDTTNQLLEPILLSVSQSLSQGNTATPPDDAPIDLWLAGVEPIFKFLLERNRDALEAHFQVPGDAAMYVKVMARSALNKSLPQYRKFLRPRAEPVHVIAELAKTAAEGKFDDSYGFAVLAMQEVSRDWSWQPFMEAAKNRLQFTGTWAGTEMNGLLRSLVMCRSGKKEADAALSALTKGGYLQHHLYAASKDINTASLLVIPILENLPAGNLEHAVGNAQAGANTFIDLMRNPENKKDYIPTIAATLYNSGRTEMLFSLPELAPHCKPFVNAVLNHMVTIWEKSYRFIDPSKIVERKDLFKDALTAEQFQKMVEESVANRSLIEEITEYEFELTLSDLYLLALKSDPSNANLKNFLVEGLRAVTTEAWLGQLREEGLLLDVLFELIGLGCEPNLTVAFEDALSSHAEQLVNGTVAIKRFPQRWTEVAQALEAPFRQTALQRLLELICTSDSATDQLLAAYGELLAATEVINFATDKNRLVLYGFEHILQRRRLTELLWTLKVLQKNPNLLSEVNAATRRNFEERLATASREQGIGEEVQSAIQGIARTAGIDLAKLTDVQESTGAESASSKG